MNPRFEPWIQKVGHEGATHYTSVCLYIILGKHDLTCIPVLSTYTKEIYRYLYIFTYVLGSVIKDKQNSTIYP